MEAGSRLLLEGRGPYDRLCAPRYRLSRGQPDKEGKQFR